MTVSFPLRWLAFALVLTLTCSVVPGYADDRGAARERDLRDLIRFAGQVTERSGCLGAACVRMDCAAAPQLWRALLSAQWEVGALDAPLTALRDLELNNTVNLMAEAGLSRDRADWLRDLQLIQDSIAVVYVVASEIASALELRESLATNAEDWKRVFGGEAPLDRFPILKDLKSIADRANALSKYSSIGEDGPQDIPWAEIAKAATEGYLTYQDLARKSAAGTLTTAAKRTAWLKQLKALGDILLKIDRLRRQSRIAEYERDAAASLAAGEAAFERMAQINETRRLALEAEVALNRAFNAFFVCHREGCGTDAGPPGQPDWAAPAPVDTELALASRIREHDQRLRQVRDALAVTAIAYGPIIDWTSRMAVERRRVSYRQDAVATYAIQTFLVGNEATRCIPSDAWLTVVRGTGDGTGEEIMAVAPAAEAEESVAFKIQEDLAGTWRTVDGSFEIELGTINDEVRLTRADTPVSGRSRVYSGTLLRDFSQPGDYTLVLRSGDKSYLPTHFTVIGPDTVRDRETTALSVPADIADISPAIPPDIRAKLLADPYRTTFRYRAALTPELRRNAEPVLHLELHNHRLGYGRDSREIVAGSLQEKLERRVLLNRAP